MGYLCFFNGMSDIRALSLPQPAGLALQPVF